MTNTVYRNGAGEAVRSFAYAYDPDGLLTQQVTVADGAAVTRAYAYDGLGRLVSADGVAYAYDLAGNRLSVVSTTNHEPSTTNRSTYAHNRLDGDLYDAAGSVTNMPRNGAALSLTWDTLGQLVSVATNGAFAESYAYDPLGRRVATTTYPLNALGVLTPLTAYHVYDGNECAADVDASGNLRRSYAWGPGIDDLLAVTVYTSGATNSFFAIKDRLGSVVTLVDASGAVAESYTYDAWGNVSILTSDLRPLTSSQFGNRYLFQGREFSSATGRYNFRARWYDPASGRWLSKDPIGLEGGLNLYEFCGDNPVNGRDPGGLLTDGQIIATGIAAGAIIGGTIGFFGGGAAAVVGSVTGPGEVFVIPAGAAAGATQGAAIGGTAGGSAAAAACAFARGLDKLSDEFYSRGFLGEDARDRSDAKLKAAWERLQKMGKFEGTFDDFKDIIHDIKDACNMTGSMESQSIDLIVNLFLNGGL